jgi:uncharacterized membrane protein YphA (DoxX/SURF4 family)
MMINGYSKLRNLKQAADETKQTHGNPIGATYIATMLKFFGGIFLIIGLMVFAFAFAQNNVYYIYLSHCHCLFP